MNILLIDFALPDSIFSGKTVRLKNIYGRLAKDHSIVFLRTSMVGEENESSTLDRWAQNVFQEVLRLPYGASSTLAGRLRNLLMIKPWFEISKRYSGELPQVKRFIKELLVKYEIDLVINFANEAAQFGEALKGIIPWIQDLGDSMVMQHTRQFKKAVSIREKLWLATYILREKSFEQEMIRKAQATIFVSADDAKLYKDLGFVEIIPNGVDTDYFSRALVTEYVDDSQYVVFTGHMNFKPNIDAAIYFTEKILPLVRKQIPNLKFKIAGADPTDKVLRLRNIVGVEVTGAVPDLRPYLAGATAFVCPMRMGSGIKNKLLEAMAMEVPIVANALAAKGILNIPEGIVFFAETPDFFAQALVRLLLNAASAKEMAKMGRNFVVQNYSWGLTIQKYQRLFEKSLSSKGYVANKV